MTYEPKADRKGAGNSSQGNAEGGLQDPPTEIGHSSNPDYIIKSFGLKTAMLNDGPAGSDRRKIRGAARNKKRGYDVSVTPWICVVPKGRLELPPEYSD